MNLMNKIEVDESNVAIYMLYNCIDYIYNYNK